MAQIFQPFTNTLSKASVFGALGIVAGGLWLLGVVERSPYATQAGVALDQPLEFSHRHHVAGMGIDCRYCHTTAETSSVAGIPATEVCMTCHQQIWADSPSLAPVRESFATGRPLRWVRVHDLPDHAYFDHSIHLASGIGCSSCHGRVDLMPLTWRDATLHMEWCLDCHRDPEPHRRPREELYRTDWQPRTGTPPPATRDLQVTNCSVCHR